MNSDINIDFVLVRQRSLFLAKQFGYEITPALPLLEVSTFRSKEEIIFRSLALFATVACSYGLDKEAAINWLDREGLVKELAASEREFIFEDVGDASHYQSQVEGLNAFAWSLNLVSELPFDSTCQNSLIRLFPDIKNGGDVYEYKHSSEMRSPREIAECCDLAYCLHWIINDVEQRSKYLPEKMVRHVIVERRRALEWIITVEGWDDLTLDT